MPRQSKRILALALLSPLAAIQAASAAQSADERNLNELRNTVINLLEALVAKGVVTREQAQAMVDSAQTKAASDAAAAAATADAQEKADAGAVRVPYVPEVVKEEIRKQVVAEVTPQITQGVIEEAKSDHWGVLGAMPDWVQRMKWSGDVRMRGQGDLFASENLPNSYQDVLAVNSKGGIAKAAQNAFLNTTQNRERLRARLRLGFETELGWGWSVAGRLATGNLQDAVSTNQTLGNTGARYQTGLDLAYIKWSGNSATGRNSLNVWGGRLPNPWLSTDLVWDPDLTFEGVAANYRLGLSRDDPYSKFVYMTVGAFPLQEIEVSPNDKWLYGAQLGLQWKFAGGSGVRFGLAYYDYQNITGRRNTLDSTLLDYTAPQFVQKGNTLFDIRVDSDVDPNTSNLFALASDYRLVDVTLAYDWKLSPNYRLSIIGDAVRNIGFDEQQVAARIGFAVPKRNEGYQAEVSFGSNSLGLHGAWRAFFGYRYLQSDAVLDAFTDSDFHLGGTNAQGYFIGADYAITPRVVTRLRYLSANEIDGLPFGVDVFQLDLTAQF